MCVCLNVIVHECVWVTGWEFVLFILEADDRNGNGLRLRVVLVCCGAFQASVDVNWKSASVRAWIEFEDGQQHDQHQLFLSERKKNLNFIHGDNKTCSVKNISDRTVGYFRIPGNHEADCGRVRRASTTAAINSAVESISGFDIDLGLVFHFQHIDGGASASSRRRRWIRFVSEEP